MSPYFHESVTTYGRLGNNSNYRMSSNLDELPKHSHLSIIFQPRQFTILIDPDLRKPLPILHHQEATGTICSLLPLFKWANPVTETLFEILRSGCADKLPVLIIACDRLPSQRYDV